MSNFDTKKIRAGYNSEEHNYSVNVPIYQTAAFDLADTDRAARLWALEEKAGIYSRIGNPTVGVLEERIRLIDGGKASVAVASGMAAISYTILALAEGGGNIVAASSLYGGSQDAFKNFYTRLGIETRFVEDRHNPAAYDEYIDENTKAVYIESISNPNAELYNVEDIAKIAHKHGVPLVVDNTVATPYLYSPFEHGADIIVYSATKGLGGHGTTVGGIIVEKGDFNYSPERYPQLYKKLYKSRDRQGNPRSPHDLAPESPLVILIRALYLEYIGAALSPFSAYEIIQGFNTISERLSKQVSSAEKIVEFLETRSEVEWVRHPSAKNSPFKSLAERDFPRGAGAILSFGFKGTLEQFDEFIGHLNYFSYHVNIGDVRSLIVNSPKTTHGEFTAEELKFADIPDNLVRISVGLEDPRDLIEDLENAFNHVFGNERREA